MTRAPASIQPDPQISLDIYQRMRRRHGAGEALTKGWFEQRNQNWEAMTQIQKRVTWHDQEDGLPRLLYKIRESLTTDEGLSRSSDILLRHQLWLADASKYSDHQDSRIDYRVTRRGQELRREMVSHVRHATGLSRSQAELQVSDAVVRDPEFLMRQFNANAEQILRDMGICSLAGNARDPRLWEEYGEDGRGIGFQFSPALDSRAFIAIERIHYSDEERVIENRMFGDAVIAKRKELLMTKRSKYKFEDEWRIVVGGTANAPQAFDSTALTGVILGPNAEPSKPLLVKLLEQRQHETGLALRVYQAIPAEDRIRMKRIGL